MKNYPNEEYKKVFDKLKALDISDNSARIYTYSIYNILKVLLLDLDENIFNDYNFIIKNLKKKNYKLNTYKNKISSIIAFLKAYNKPKKIIDKYNNEIDVAQSQILRQLKKFEKSDKEKENWMTKDELNKKLKDMKKKIILINDYDDLKELIKYTVLLFHLNFPMRNDLADTEIYKLNEYKKIKPDNNINYLILDNKNALLILNNYKTKKHHGKQKLLIDNDELNKTLKIYYKELIKYKKDNDINNKWFIIKEKGDKLNRNEYTKLFNNIFNKNISTSLLRKIIVSDTWNGKEIKELADKMQHTPQQALNSYLKLD